MKILLSLFLLLSYSVLSQKGSISPLQLSEIMKGNEFVGNLPENIRWSIDGQQIVFDWNPSNENGNSTYIYSVASKKYAKATKEELIKLLEADGSQKGHPSYYFSLDGYLVEYDIKTKQSKLIYQTNTGIYNVQRVANSENVYFQQGNNLFVYDRTIGGIRQITYFIKGEKPKEKNDTSFLVKQQEELFQYIRDQKTRKSWNKEQDYERFSFPDEQYYSGGDLNNLQISADGRYVTFRISIYASDKSTHVENHISKDGYTYTSSARSKVTNSESSHKVGIYDLTNEKVYYVDFSSLSDIRKKPLYLADYGDKKTLYEEDRKVTPQYFQFSKNGKYAVLEVLSNDNKDRWIVNIDLPTGKVTELDKQHDEAWIGGPGISVENIGWLNDNETIYFQSEVTGYSHLYTLNLRTKEKQALTSGKWEIHKAILSSNGKTFYLTANKTHPGNRDFYHLDIASKKLSSILSANGFHDVVISPDEKILAIRYSYKNKPWELYVAPNTVNSTMVQITSSTTEQFKKYQWREPEVVTFKGSDGVDVYARLYTPKGDVKNKAAVIFVHGAGYLQNAHNYWSHYYREYMFHNLLVDNGYTVLDIDYRASEGYGRDYRTAIYRFMGGRDLQDHLDGKNFLVNKMGIDSNRIGIYGGSYGGFITLMSLLTAPKEFACGAALRSVTDWAHYNQGYTSNILNFPETDPIAYKKSSPIYFAENLEKRLLMLHGMVDDNVQFQDVVRLSQRFIELGKTNWELAVFPVEAHGFKESYSWNDEYRRIYDLFYEELILKYK